MRKEGKAQVTEYDACLRMTGHSDVKIGEDYGTMGPVCCVELAAKELMVK